MKAGNEQIRQNTLSYYDNNASAYIADTVAVDMSSTQERFLRQLEKGARILDFGCGSGRDSKYFLQQGYAVTAVDGSEKFCRYASSYTGLTVKRMLFQELAEQEAYEGVWACASILHLPENELETVLRKIRTALVAGGVLYTSFKYGDFAGERSGRYFTYLTEDGLTELLHRVGGLRLIETWVTGDMRPGRGSERWLNVLARRSL